MSNKSPPIALPSIIRSGKLLKLPYLVSDIMSELIAPNSLKDLVDAKAIRHATVVAEQGSFKITVKYGMVERTVSVRTRGGQIKERVFSSLDAVARFLHDKVHLAHYDVDAANFDPTRKPRKRPDTSRRLAAAHAALADNATTR